MRVPLKPFYGLAAHPAGGAVKITPARAFFQLGKLVVQLVILTVADGRIIQNVILVRPFVKLFYKFPHSVHNAVPANLQYRQRRKRCR